QVVAYEHEIGHLFGPKSALGIILAIPAVIFGIVIRKHLSRALSLGAVGSLGSVQQEIGWVRRRYRETHRVANLLASPAHALVLFLLAFPLGLSLYLSFTSWTATAGIPPWEASFVGLQNYINILNDTRFTDSLIRTGIVTVVPLAIELVVGLVLALLFLDKFRGRDPLMIVFLLPLLIIPPVTAVNFHALFYPHGAFDSILSLIAMTEISIPWFTNPNITLWLIILGEAWKWAPFMFLILLAGLLGLPQEPLRAARILGASEWQIFRHLTLPMLKPFIITALLIRAILSFRQFDLPRIMTAGGPGTATETVAIFFEMNFDLFARFSYASAGVFIVIGIMAVGTYLTVRRLLR
ncbi:MAG: carbohydrate ABC transporter permease, partial [Candidatus Bathyarchaeia archaeon]